MKWVLFLLMFCIIIPGLHYTGFITLFKDSSSKPATELPSDTKEKTEKKSDWSPIPSPKWQAQNLNGDTFFLKDLKGKIIILNFWASWCLPCHKEFPELIAAAQWAKGEIHLVAVSVDSSKEDIESFLKRYNFNFSKYYTYRSSGRDSSTISNKKNKPYIHIIWDPKFKVAHQFNVVKFPETFILNRDLKIVKKYTGEFSLKKTKKILESLLLSNKK